MKSPKTLHSAQNHPAQKPRHSSSLLWPLLILVMLSGLLYLGSRVRQQWIVKPFEHSNNPSQHLPTTTRTNMPPTLTPQFGNILATLKSQQLINPVVYKTKIVLTNDVIGDATQNHDALWQHGQQQLTFIQATIRAGVNLSELNEQSLSSKAPITLHLPPARITLIQIDNITMYDVKTGQPSTVQMGLSLTSDQEKNIKAQVEREFCQSEVLQATTEETRQHVISLLDAIKVSMVVRVTEPVGCKQTAS